MVQVEELGARLEQVEGDLVEVRIRSLSSDFCRMGCFCDM